VSVCGVGAMIESVDPAITVRLKGVVAGPYDAMLTCKPLGTDWNVSVMVCGYRAMLVVVDRPPESVAVSCRTSQEG
jgi:hypothetical protein